LAAFEACTSKWDLGTNSAFSLGPREITENLDPPIAGPSGCKLTSPTVGHLTHEPNPNVSPHLASALFENFYRFVLIEPQSVTIVLGLHWESETLIVCSQECSSENGSARSAGGEVLS
jgi:hypothetical protein